MFYIFDSVYFNRNSMIKKILNYKVAIWQVIVGLIVVVIVEVLIKWALGLL